DLGSRLTPVAIRHAQLDLSWKVLQLLEDWTTPRYHDAVGMPAETKRFVVRVRGPLPGNPSCDGEFTMTIRRFGDRPGWWASPEGQPTGLRGAACPQVGPASLCGRGSRPASAGRAARRTA